MKKGEVRNFIYSLLEPLVAEKGFRLKKAGEGIFIRSIPGGNQRIGVPLVDRNPTFKFSLIVTIRLDAVEEVVSKFNTAPAQHHSDTHTLTARLERFMPGQETQFTVVTEKDIEAAFARLKPVIQARIIPFLEETQDILTLAKAMNLTEVPQVLPGGANKSALAIARLVQHPDFEKIATTYQQRISQYPKAAQEEWANFVQYVKKLDLKTPA